MSGHTPAPWVVAIRPADESLYISMGNPTRGAHCQFDLGCTLADALLIAAAPDLLAACKMVAAMAVGWEPLTPGDIAEVTTAIAKAEGK